MTDGGYEHSEDKMRLCPTCRMDISVLAIKCRYCGEVVGRPRDESRQMTIDDLGGESVTHYAPSANVLDALETFRTDEARSRRAAEELKRKRFLTRRARKGEEDEAAEREQGALPELDEQSRTLAASMAEPVSPAPTSEAPKPTWMKKIGFFGAFVAAIVILYFGGMKVAAVFGPKDTGGVTYHNRAPGLIKQGAAPIKILEAAMEAVKRADYAGNQKVAAQARSLVMKQVQGLIDVQLWERSKLQEASRLANRAADMDSNEHVQRLKAEVAEENIAYSVLLQSVDTTATPPTATFSLSDPRNPGATSIVAEGDLLVGRFKLKNVSKRRVRAEDIKRKNRFLIIDHTGVS